MKRFFQCLLFAGILTSVFGCIVYSPPERHYYHYYDRDGYYYPRGEFREREEWRERGGERGEHEHGERR